MIIVGVDIGSKGAICAINTDTKKMFLCEPLPKPLEGSKLHVSEKYNREVTEQFLYLIERVKNSVHANGEVKVYTEKLHAIFGSSAKSTFTFGYVNGWTISILQREFGSVNLIRAVDWQNHLFNKYLPEPIYKTGVKKPKKDTKAMSIHVATQFEEANKFLPSSRSRQISDGMTDAYNIARYGMEIQ